MNRRNVFAAAAYLALVGIAFQPVVTASPRAGTKRRMAREAAERTARDALYANTPASTTESRQVRRRRERMAADA